MTKHYRVLLAMLILAAFSFAFTGCGGGGGSSSVPEVSAEPETPEEPAEPTEPEGPSEEDQAAADSAKKVAEEAASALKAAIEAAEHADPAAAQAAYEAAKAAAEAVDVNDPATVEAANMAAQAANTAATDLNAEEARLMAEAEEAARLAAEQAVRDEAERIAKAIGPNAITAASSHIGTTEVDAAISGKASTTESDPVRGIDGGKITHGSASRISQRFTKDDDPISIRRWDSAAYKRIDDDENVWNVVTYTNKQAPKSESYVEFYAVTAPQPSDADAGFNYIARPEGVTSTLVNDIIVLTIAATTGATTAETLKLMSSSSFPSGALTHRDFVSGEQSGKFGGSFHGVPGTFECGSGTCRVETDSDGNLSVLGADLTFTPNTVDDPDLPGSQKVVTADVMDVQIDVDYLDFGYWLIATEGDEGTSYEFHSFARGKTGVDLNATRVRGTAKYSGPATGVYMKKQVNPDGSPTPLASGQFRATAELTAHFGQLQNATGQDTIAANMLNTISGTVSDFRDSEGSPIAETWSAELNSLGITALSTGSFTGGTTTGGGNWEGQFYGTVEAAADDASTGTRPSSLGGTFDAHFSNGHVAGAFATTRQGKE